MALYRVIENDYGGTDQTDFRVPDLRGRFPTIEAEKQLGSAGDGIIAAGQLSNDQGVTASYIIKK